MDKQRPRIRIQFKYNVDTGEIEEFIVDDNAMAASEAYHDEVAKAIAGRLGRHPDIDDAGPIRVSRVSDTTVKQVDVEKEKEKPALESKKKE